MPTALPSASVNSKTKKHLDIFYQQIFRTKSCNNLMTSTRLWCQHNQNQTLFRKWAHLLNQHKANRDIHKHTVIQESTTVFQYQYSSAKITLDATQTMNINIFITLLASILPTNQNQQQYFIIKIRVRTDLCLVASSLVPISEIICL
jgi:hypothetical protein